MTVHEDFDDFYRESVASVVHLVYVATGDLELARGATQEAYLRAWQRWPEVSRADSPLSWVRTVARRAAISTWRKDSNRLRAAEITGTPSTTPGPDETRLLVLTALRQLRSHEREALALHYLADLSVEQIARETSTPPGTVKARLHRGRAHLAQVLAEKEAQP